MLSNIRRSQHRDILKTWTGAGGQPLKHSPEEAARLASQISPDAIAQNRRSVLLREASRPQHWGQSSATEEFLEQHPECLEVLGGSRVLSQFSLPGGPGWLSDAQGQQILEDLQVLSRRLTIAQGDRLSLEQEPQRPGSWLLLNTSQLQRALAPIDLGESWKQRDLSLANLAPDQPLRRFAQELTPPNSCPLPDGPPVAGPIQQAGMIAYCQSSQQLDELALTLKSWSQNLRQYQHQLQFQLLDDSPPPFGEQVRQLVGEFPHFSYLGQPEKDLHRERLQAALLTSPKWEDFGRPASFAGQVVERLFGSRLHSGPTENRNLSLLLLQGQEAFQCDHDMRPEVLLAGREQQAPQTLNIDLISALEQQPWHDRIVSPELCGYEDLNPKQLDNLHQRGGEVKRLIAQSPPDTSLRYNESAQIWAPMLVPGRCDNFLPLSPPCRDGDLLLGGLMRQFSGLESQKIPARIHHTQPTGSQWNQSLEEEFAFSRSLLSHIIRHAPGQTLEQRGTALWDWLESPQSQSELQSIQAREALEAYAVALRCWSEWGPS